MVGVVYRYLVWVELEHLWDGRGRFFVRNHRPSKPHFRVLSKTQKAKIFEFSPEGQSRKHPRGQGESWNISFLGKPKCMQAKTPIDTSPRGARALPSDQFSHIKKPLRQRS